MPTDRTGSARDDAPPPSSSSWQAVLTGLRGLAHQLGIEVRIEAFELKMAGKGGLCRLRGRRIILVDEKLGVVEQVGVVGEALGRVVPEGAAVPLDLLPYLRTGHRKVLPLLRPRPLARGR